MDNQELIRHFYEVVFSNQLLDELPELVAEDCVLREGEELIPTGIDGMRQNLLPGLPHEGHPAIQRRRYCHLGMCDGGNPFGRLDGDSALRQAPAL